jgi:hypothetical protein
LEVGSAFLLFFACVIFFPSYNARLQGLLRDFLGRFSDMSAIHQQLLADEFKRYDAPVRWWQRIWKRMMRPFGSSEDNILDYLPSLDEDQIIAVPSNVFGELLPAHRKFKDDQDSTSNAHTHDSKAVTKKTNTPRNPESCIEQQDSAADSRVSRDSLNEAHTTVSSGAEMRKVALGTGRRRTVVFQALQASLHQPSPHGSIALQPDVGIAQNHANELREVVVERSGTARGTNSSLISEDRAPGVASDCFTMESEIRASRTIIAASSAFIAATEAAGVEALKDCDSGYVLARSLGVSATSQPSPRRDSDRRPKQQRPSRAQAAASEIDAKLEPRAAAFDDSDHLSRLRPPERAQQNATKRASMLNPVSALNTPPLNFASNSSASALSSFRASRSSSTPRTQNNAANL